MRRFSRKKRSRQGGDCARRGAWRFEIRVGDFRAIAVERPDRGNTVTVRWTDPAKTGRERRRKHSLDLVVRDERGNLDPELVAKAEMATVEFFNEHTEANKAPAPPPAFLTLEAGVALALAPAGPTVAAANTSDRKTITGYGEVLKEILGRDTKWVDIVPGDVERISRVRAEYYNATGRGGERTTERIIATLFAIAAWLRQRGKIPSNAAVHPPKWRKAHRMVWAEVTKRERAVAHPRHTKDEFAAILSCWNRADPRLHLALEIGAELRLGQVLKTPRSKVAIGLPCDILRLDAPTPFGVVEIPGSGKKQGGTIYLTAAQRAALDAAFVGYLSAYEGAFRRGEINDYPLFPGGEMIAGRLSLAAAPKLWDRRAALRAFHALEHLAGVPPVPGRGWYGIRRQVTDLAPGYTRDPRVLDRLCSNTEDTRRRIYQDQIDHTSRMKAARVREKLRTGLERGAAKKRGAATRGAGSAAASERAAVEDAAEPSVRGNRLAGPDPARRSRGRSTES